MRVLFIFLVCVKILSYAAPVPQLSTAGQVREHWAFKKISSPLPLKTKNKTWPKNPIDRFVLLKLERRGWTPSPHADKRTLIRRAYMDLTGLMPSFEEVREFTADNSSDAWANLIEHLLASPHYGERWGRHWLDVARYADNKGYVGVGVDRAYPYSYTYRDYVVRSLNEDLPFNQFIIEQIAADFLDLGEDRRALAAMGFLTLGRRFLNQQDDIIDDRIDVVTRGFMGLTVTCARCHDHKYDPIPTADYYSLHGIFASSDEPKDLPLLGRGSLPAQHNSYLKEKAEKEKEIADLIRSTYKKKREELRGRAGEYMLAVHEVSAKKLQGGGLETWLISKKLNKFAFRNWSDSLSMWKQEKHPVFIAWHCLDGSGTPLVPRVDGVKAQAEIYGKVFQEAQKRWKALQKKDPKATGLGDKDWEAVRRILYDTNTPARVPEKLDEGDRNSLLFGIRNRLRSMRSEIGKLSANHPGSPPRAHVLVDKAKPVDPYIFIRGNSDNRGPKVSRRFLEHLSGDRKPFVKGSGRLELAEAIADSNNPLTARVLANRVWAHHFGRGLVATRSDFGLRAQSPSHPLLLDWLATSFMTDGWSIKSLHRKIMLSATYQQTSNNRVEYITADPSNPLLWKMNRQRISFESLRDTILQASGQLDLKVGGRPVKIHTHPASTRRTLYGFIDRQNLPAVFRTFDFANPDTHCPKRFENIVPQQALFLMNSSFVHDQAKHLIQQKGFVNVANDKAKLQFLHQTIFQRNPSTTEIQEALVFLSPKGAASWSDYAQVLLLSNEFRFVD
jgi:hypothetical protein